MKFLVDAQLPPALAVWLRKSGHEADHVRDVDLLFASDGAIREHVHRTAAILISKDRDFVRLEGDNPTIRLVWIRTGNMTVTALLERVAQAWPSVVAHLSAGEQLVELR